MGVKNLTKKVPKSSDLAKRDENQADLISNTSSLSHLDTFLPVPRLSFPASCALVGVAAFLCYWHTVYGDFVFDDSEAIINNKDVIENNSVFDLFLHDFWGTKIATKESHKSYRPLTVLTFRWNLWLAGGLQPWSFHAVNIVLHVIVSVLSFKLFLLLLNDGERVDEYNNASCPRASLLCAVLFAVHPIHSETVAGVVGRADLLGALCFFSCFVLFCNSCVHGQMSSSASVPSLLVCVFLAAIGMLFKEQGITVLGFCIVYDILIVCKFNPVKNLLRQKNDQTKSGFAWPEGFLLRQMILWLGGISMMVMRWQIMGFSPPQFTVVDNPASFEKSWITRVLNYNYIYSLNLWILVYPWWLCFDWSMGCVSVIKDMTDVRILAPVTMWIVLLGILWKAFCSSEYCSYKRCVLIALALLVVPFLPATNLFFRVGFVIAERVLYLSSAGYCMLLVLGLMAVCQITILRKLVRVFLWPFILILAARSFQRSSEWLTEPTLFTSGEDVCPNNAKVHYNIGKIKSEQNDNEQALQYYREAIRLHPEYDQALNNLGNLLKDLGETQEAETMLERAVAARSTFAAGWMNLGIVKSALNKTKDAEKCYFLAIKHRNVYPDAYFNLGNLYIQTQQTGMAKAAFEKAHQMKPDHASAWLNHVLLMENTGKFEEAITIAKKAQKILPGNANIHSQLGSIYGKMDKYEESEKNFLQALSLNPRSGSIHANLGVLYHRWGKKDQAEKFYRQALKLDPTNYNAKDNLRMLLKTKAK